MFNAVVFDFSRIRIYIEENCVLNLNHLTIVNGDSRIDIEQAELHGSFADLILKQELNIKQECTIQYSNVCVKAIYREIFNSVEFNKRYYKDLPLGCFYEKDKTLFRVWSPAAEAVNLLIYSSGDAEIYEEPRRLSMKEEGGFWSLTVLEDLEGLFYTYEVKVYGRVNEAVDPYAKALGINGLRGAVIDLSKTNPEKFELDLSPKLETFTDAIIYETSIRDISMHPNSGVKNKGKFLGLAEEATKSDKGTPTALGHILDIGVTHVQLMPIYDFSYVSTDERNPEKYNWGYDPQNYNAPEGSYSTDPYNPAARILELKTLVQTLHSKGLAVNMDVVYNHVFNLKTENLEKIFPGYYFRVSENGKFSNGSGCSNDTASERLMMRKFIVDSTYYWAKEYHLDGFRFDLMGLHDVTTINSVREKLNSLNRTIMLYGEGWILGTLLPEDFKANMLNAAKMPHIGHFNDTVRNAVRGGVFNKHEKGFVSGKEDLEDAIRLCAAGCTDYFSKGGRFFQTPDQSINYVSAHDNNTLWDKLKFSSPEASEDELKAMQKLANAIVLTCQGVAFLHSGEEFCRTKQGVEDSVKAGDNINWMDWDRKSRYMDVVDYYKGLIKLRREHSAFKMTAAAQIRKHLEFLNTSKGSVGFILKNFANNDTWKDIIVIYNANKHNIFLTLPEGIWNVVADKYSSGIEIIRQINGGEVEVESISMLLLYR